MYMDESQRPGPNDPCHCGSGKKYKKCHRPKDLLADRMGETPATTAPAPPEPASSRPPVVAGTLSPKRSVPEDIPRPDYAERGRPLEPRPKNLVKTPEQIERMRVACAAARRVLETTIAAVRPGITTDALDAIAHEAYIAEGGYPSPLNYHGFPKSICTSVNEVICHGIPDSRELQDGDIVNIDVTIFLGGMHGDCSETVLVGEVDEATRTLVQVTKECMMRGIGAVRPGGRIRDIGRAIEGVAGINGYGVVRAFVGHGIGEVFHMDPAWNCGPA
jgi:methionyl aminopeptidase